MKTSFYFLFFIFVLTGCVNPNAFIHSSDKKNSLTSEQMNYLVPKLRHSKMRIQQINKNIVIEAESTVFFANKQYSSFNENGYIEYRKIIDFMIRYPESIAHIYIHTEIQGEKVIVDGIINEQAKQFSMATSEIASNRIKHKQAEAPQHCLVDNILRKCPTNRVVFILSNKED